MSEGYSEKWDQQYFNDYFANKSCSFWDVAPELSIGRDYDHFKRFLNLSIPLLDIGCGTGAESEWLSRKLNKVIGVDVSKYAIRLAKSGSSASNVEFRVSDITNTKEVESLHLEFGDCNVYMRGVMHQITKEDLEVFIDNLAILIGDSGILVFNEVKTGIREYLDAHMSGFKTLPEKMKKAILSNLPPQGVTENELKACFARNWKWLEMDASHLCTNITFDSGLPIEIPSLLGVLESGAGE